jgi:tetratricopeptide (TPR) repeat protein
VGREERLAAVQARLEQVAATRDLSPVLEPGALIEARRLTQIVEDDDGDLGARHLLGWLHWYRFNALPQGQGRQDLEAAVAMLTPCFIARTTTWRLPEQLLPALAAASVPTATALLQQALGSPDEDLISAAVDLWRHVLDATPTDEASRAAMLTNLGAALQNRFERTGAQADLEAAIEAGQAAVDATPAGHPDRAAMLSNLGVALRSRFERIGAQADLEAAIEAGQAAVDATPPGDPDRAGRLSNLWDALWSRFERTGAQADLEAAIEAIEAAVDATPPGDPDRAGRLSNLRTALRSRFERTGAQADLEAAIEAGQAAVDATPVGHPDRAAMLSNLGNALWFGFRRTGAQADLEAAIEADQAAVDATPVGHPDCASYLTSLAVALRSRFERTGAQADLEAAIEAGQAAVDATPAGHPDRAMYLSNLGNALWSRFKRNGAQADLEAAIEAGQAAVDATPLGHPNRSRYRFSLGAALWSRFERTGAQADQDAAIEAIEAAVQATPAGHPDRAAMLSNLGVVLRHRFERTGAQADLEAAIEAGWAAVDATFAGHPDRAGMLSNLGIALQSRFQRTGTLRDLDAAIEAIEAAVQVTPAGHPDLASYLFNLGIALRSRFQHTGRQADLDKAVFAYEQAAGLEAAAPSVRIRAARAVAALAAGSEPGRVAGLLEAAVRLLPEVAPRQLERGDQQYAIGGFAGLAGDAAAFALVGTGGGVSSGERAMRALGLVETGRAVLLSQALDTRSDLTDLGHQHPELAERFIKLREQLDQAEGIPPPVISPDPSPDSPGRKAENRRRLANEFTAVLEQIRALDGFASFGLPPSTGELLAEAGPGPVVTFSVSAYRSDALVLTEHGITSLELAGLAYETLISQISSFHQARLTAAAPGAGVADRIAAERKLLEILGWLWDVAVAPVLDALGYHQPPPPGAAWPRVWWAPGGLLGLLPVHAAGHHTQAVAGDQAQRTVMDRVISSYTPTIRALRYARQHHPTLPTGRALIVAMPFTPGLPGDGELPNVPMEVARVRALLPDTVLLTEPGDQRASGSSGSSTLANVLAHLPACPVAHFACHGFSDPADPSKSLLLLSDYDRHPLTVASLAPVDLGQAELAYLSACDTALTSTADLIDEAIHLTTAFQLAGFPHVIGTLWEINDALAVDIATSFYRELRTSPHTVDTSQAARALHRAVRAARDELPRVPSLWAAYIHAGT